MHEENIGTSGFYKNDNGVLLYAPNFVCGPYETFSLLRENKDEYTYPVSNWYWFESQEIAIEQL